MDWLRVITGFLIVLLVSFFTWVGGVAFLILITLLSSVALWEFYRLVIYDGVSFSGLLLSAFGLLCSVVIILSANISGTEYIALILLLNLIFVAFFTLSVFKNNPRIALAAAKQIFGLIYIPTSLSLLVIIRNDNYGFLWSIVSLCVVAVGDTGAYYIGGLLGHYKLCPHISPKKSVEGFLGGLFCAVITILLFRFYLFSSLSVGCCIFFACVVTILGQIGDLFASEFKRIAGVKDYGRLLPGHGGFLDRIDALLLALPGIYLFRLAMVF